MSKTDEEPPRRRFLKGLGLAGATVAGGGSALAAAGAAKEAGSAFADSVETLLQDHYLRMSPDEIKESLARIERRAKRDYGVELTCADEKPMDGVVFGYALNLSKCKGYRMCVEACVEENNCPAEGTLRNIRVLALEKGDWDLNKADHYYPEEMVEQPHLTYLPVQCHHCDDPPCVQACPVQATWKEPDGIVVVDYDWCIGCRYCATACPYWARHFNWKKPELDPADMVTETHYLGNRPRPRGVMEKCTFCVHRVRKGEQPACLEACPTGARVFGNLMDPQSPIRYVLENKPVFRLKEDLGTEPKFWYFTDG